MREQFVGYYPLSEKQFEELWRNCIFVLDTNVLLHLYSYSPQTYAEFINLLSQISNRLWIPHQVALEYHFNRLTTIRQQEQTYKEVTSILNKTLARLKQKVSGEHLSIDARSLLSKIKETFASIKEELSEWNENHPDLYTRDNIRDDITNLFQGKVGEPYSQERLNEIYEHGADRYEFKIPPGYGDHTKKDIKRFEGLEIQDKYGDLILWFQIIDKAKDSESPVIVITDDQKEDWWWKFSGHTLGPRPEMVSEISREAEADFYMYTAHQFIKYAGEYLEFQITQEAIDEVQDVAEAKSDWKNEVIDTLMALDGQASLSDIYSYINRNTTRELAETWQATVRNTLYTHSSDSDAFDGGEDVFEHVDRGVWALREAYRT